MSAPPIPCRVEARAPIHPSEDPQKVLRAVLNMMEGCPGTAEGPYATAVSGDTAPLDALRDAMAARRSQAGLYRNLQNNLDGDTTWFYLNKQAAFAGTPAVCDDPDESPLGPIRITVTSGRIHDIMRRMAPEAYG